MKPIASSRMISQIRDVCAPKRTKSILTLSLFLTMNAISQTKIRTKPIRTA